MQIVIDIPEDRLNSIKQFGIKQNEVYMLEKALINSTSLPKGHGRLIDVNDLLDDIGLKDCDENRDCNVGEIITLENVDRIPTIIEADKEGDKE